MTRIYHFMIAMTLLGLFGSVTAFADEVNTKSAIYQMAEIMHRLKHYPSPAGKEVLNKIVQSPTATKNERTLATAMINLEHTVDDSDVPKLKAIIGDASASDHEKQLANIILNLNHRPTKEDKAQLKAMMQ